MKNISYRLLAGSLWMLVAPAGFAGVNPTVEDFSAVFLKRLGLEIEEGKALAYLEKRISGVQGRGWQSEDLATEKFVSQFQASFQILLKDVSLELGIDPPPTLSLTIFEVEPAPQSILYSQEVAAGSMEAGAAFPPTPPQIDAAELAKLRSNTRGPVIIEGPGMPTPPSGTPKSYASEVTDRPDPDQGSSPGEMPPPPPGGFILPDIDPDLDVNNTGIVEENGDAGQALADRDLEALLETQPRVRVIVSLRPVLGSGPPGTGTPDEILRAQEQVFQEMPEDFRLIHRYESVFAFAAEVGAQALEKLKSHKLVVQIVADFNVDLATPGPHQ